MVVPEQTFCPWPESAFSSPLFRRYLDSALDFLFPPRCLVCGEDIASASTLVPVRVQKLICRSCCHRPAKRVSNTCSRCGIGFSEFEDCSDCDTCQLLPSSIEKLYSLFSYSGRIEQQIKRFKYHGNSCLSAYFVELLLAFLESENSQWHFDTVLAVPSSRSNLAHRGYGHMQLIASGLARRQGLPAPRFALKSRGKRRAQVGLQGKERVENMRDAFASNRAMLQGRSVLLLDDVITSGSSIFEAARELSRSGVRRIEVLCIAQSPLLLQHLMENRSIHTRSKSYLYAC